MSSRHFVMIAIVVIVLVLVATNWTQVKAAAVKTIGSLPGVTGSSGSTSSSSSGSGTSSSSTSSSNSGKQVGSDYNKVLSKGVSGPEVLELQQLLNRVNSAKKQVLNNLVEDGKFGPLTEQMLQIYGGVTSITLNQAYAKVTAAFGM